MAFLKFNIGYLNLIRTTKSCLPLARIGHILLKPNKIPEIIAPKFVLKAGGINWVWMTGTSSKTQNV